MEKKDLPKNHPFSPLLRMTSPKHIEQIFDLVCAQNYFDGQFGNNIPVEESRLVFRHLKEMIENECE